MGRSSCGNCGRALSFSSSYLESRLPSNWTSVLKQFNGTEHMHCLRCLGSKNCIQCGTSLGTVGGVVGDRDSEAREFCGIEVCANCVGEFPSLAKESSTLPESKKSSFPNLSVFLVFALFISMVPFVLVSNLFLSEWFWKLDLGKTGNNFVGLGIHFCVILYLSSKVRFHLLTNLFYVYAFLVTYYVAVSFLTSM